MEMQDLGQKLRMVVMAHRRIKIINPVIEEDMEATVTAEEAASIQQVPDAPLTPPNSPSPPSITEQSETSSESEKTSIISGIFTVTTENVVHQEYETTDEIKALTQEVIKTIRDIIVSKCLIHTNLSIAVLLFIEVLNV